MARKAVATSLAAVLLLTVVVAAAATTMSSQENLASAAQATSLANRETMMAQAESGSLTLTDISKVDDFLAGNPASCGEIPQYLQAISASSSASGFEGGVAYSANATVLPAPAGLLAASGPVNSSLIRPFSGPEEGAFNLEVELSVSESASGLASLSTYQTVVANVPIEVDSASSLCTSTLYALQSSFARVPPCNATVGQTVFASLLPSLQSSAGSYGFQLTAGWGFGAGCGADYWLKLVEPGVAGATGSFQWAVLGSGGTA
jgi:hypothetical protein